MTEEPAASTLGATIRQARERAGFSLRNLEAILGVSRQLLLRLEHDELDNPNPALLHRLAEALELDSDDLFTFIGYQPSDKLPSLTPYLRAKYQAACGNGGVEPGEDTALRSLRPTLRRVTTS